MTATDLAPAALITSVPGVAPRTSFTSSARHLSSSLAGLSGVRHGVHPSPSDPTGALTGESGFHPGDIDEGPVPQRFAGSTLPATEETDEAVRTRGERHIELGGGIY